MRDLKCLIISDQLVRGVPRHGVCHDVFEMTREHGSQYFEADFAERQLAGDFDLVLISGHAEASGPFIDIDGVQLLVARDMAQVRCRCVYLNACDAGRNAELLGQCFATLGANAVVAPTIEVPWGDRDNDATRIFVRSLIAGLHVIDAVRACDPAWPGENPYRVCSRGDAP